MKNNIVVIGDGVAGLSAACLLAKHFPRDLVCINVIADRGALKEQPEFARSSIHRFHDLIGLAEKDVILNTDTDFGLGMWFQSANRDYILAEGNYGSPLESVDFLSVFFDGVAFDSSLKLDNFSLNAVAARMGRFGHPVPAPASVYSTIQYGLHLESESYSKVLRSHALSLGVQFTGGECDFMQVSDSGHIESIELISGESVTADLYINCSVNSSSKNSIDIEGNSLKTIFDSVAYGYRPMLSVAKKTTQLQSDAGGFLKIIPLKNSEHLSYVYSSLYTDSVVVTEKLNALGVESITFNHLEISPLTRHWFKNYINMAVAPSVYNLFFSPMSLVRNGAVRLLDLLSSFKDFSEIATEYNRLTDKENGQLREFIELNLFVVKDEVKAVNDYFRGNVISESARHRLDLFASYGRHPQQAGAIFSDFEWSGLWEGNQIYPKVVNPAVLDLKADAVLKNLNNLKEFIEKSVEKMPMHVDYIARATHL